METTIIGTTKIDPETKKPDITKEDLWKISDEYYAAVVTILVEQMQGEVFTSQEDYEQRIHYVMRQHCPIYYSWLHTVSPDFNAIMKKIWTKIYKRAGVKFECPQ